MRDPKVLDTSLNIMRSRGRTALQSSLHSTTTKEWMSAFPQHRPLRNKLRHSPREGELFTAPGLLHFVLDV